MVALEITWERMNAHSLKNHVKSDKWKIVNVLNFYSAIDTQVLLLSSMPEM